MSRLVNQQGSSPVLDGGFGRSPIPRLQLHMMRRRNVPSNTLSRERNVSSLVAEDWFNFSYLLCQDYTELNGNRVPGG
jgi:hypothetical protein